MKYVYGGIGLMVGLAAQTRVQNPLLKRYPGAIGGFVGFTGYMAGSNADFYQNVKKVNYNRVFNYICMYFRRTILAYLRGIVLMDPRNE